MPLLSMLSSYGVSSTLRRNSSSTWLGGTFVPASRKISRTVLTSRPRLTCSSAMARPLSRRRIGDCLVGLAYSRGLGHRVVAFQNQSFGAGLAEVRGVLHAAPE